MISLVAADLRYVAIFAAALGRSVAKAAFVFATTSFSFAGDANAASRSELGVLLAAADAPGAPPGRSVASDATLRAVTLVRKPSRGSTTRLVTAMMYASHSSLSLRSSSRPASSLDSTTRGAPFVAITAMAFVA